MKIIGCAICFWAAIVCLFFIRELLADPFLEIDLTDHVIVILGCACIVIGSALYIVWAIFGNVTLIGRRKESKT